MLTTEDILKNYKEATKMAETPQDGSFGPALVRNRGQELRQEALIEYRRRTREAAAAIILTGEGQAEFAAKAEVIGNTVTLDAGKFYRDLVAGIWESMGNGTFSVTQLLAIQNRLQQASRQYGVEIFYMPIFNGCLSHIHASPEALAEFFRKECRSLIGDALAVAATIQQMYEIALKKEIADPVVPLVIINAIEGEIPALAKAFENKAIVVETPEATEEEIIKVFTTLKNQLKPKE